MNRRFFKRYTPMLILPLLLIALACTSEDSATTAEVSALSPEPNVSPLLDVVTTIYPVTYFAERVGGDRATVESIIKTGVDAHDFEPTPSDIIKISDADVLIYNHPAFESWVADAISTSGSESLIVVKTADLPEDIEFKDAHGHGDEHGDEHGGEEAQLVKSVSHVIEEVEHGDITAEQGISEIENLLHVLEGNHEDENHKNQQEDHAEDEHLDELLEELEKVIGRVEAEEIAAGDGIEEIETIIGAHHHDEDEHGDEHGDEHETLLDPHVWLNPLEAVEQVRAIQAAFTNADQAGTSTYDENTDVLIAELLAVDKKFIDGLESCALDRVIVSHEAYGHMADRYSFEQIGLSGLSTEAEPGPQRIAKIIDEIKILGVSHILQEPIGNQELAESVASETDTEILPFHPMESLTPAEFDSGETYFSIMDENLKSLRAALRCE